MPFSNSSSYKGKWKINDKIATLLAERIKLSNQVNCISIIGLKPETDPIKIGLEKKARFVIAGDIKRFEIIQKAEISAAADKYREISIANICIHIQLIDVENKKLLYKNDFFGEVSGKNIKGNRLPHIATLPFDLKDPAFSSCILGKALNKTLDQSTAHLSRYMGFDLKKPAPKRIRY